MNLGTKIDSPSLAEAAPSQKEPKITYPEFQVRDKAAEALLKEYPCDVGEEVAATVRLKVSARREDEYGKSVSFEVIEIEDMAEESEGKDDDEGTEEPGDADEEKALGYKRPKVKKEAPTMGAKDLAE